MIHHRFASRVILSLSLLAGFSAEAAQPLSVQTASTRDSAQVVQLTAQLSEPLRPESSSEVTLLVHVEPGWHINSHTPRSEFLIPTTVTLEPSPSLTVGEVRYPNGRRRRLKFSDEALDVYETDAPLVTTVRLRSQDASLESVTLTGALSVQACNDTTCLPPSTIPFSLSLPLASDASDPADEPDSGISLPTRGGSTGAPFQHHAVWLWFLAALLGGLALNLTPCVYPMIPVTLAFFGGQGGQARRAGHTVLLGACYVVGMSLTYAALGSLAAQTGALFGSWLRHPALLIGMALLVGGLALSLFGVYELQPPGWLVQRFGQAQTGAVGALVMGLSVGLIASPCIGPFLVGLLVFVGQLGKPWIGFWLLFTTGIGMGLPYLGLAVFASRLAKWPKAGAWLVWVKKLLGVVLVGFALSLIRPLLNPLLFRWIVVVALVGAGAYLGWVARPALEGKLRWMRRAVGVGLLLGALLSIPARSERAAGPGISWQPYSRATFEQALRAGRPFLIDIFADWCVPCVELDHVTFHHPDVIARLSSMTALRVDATRDIPDDAQELLERYDIAGVPTVLLFDAHGREHHDARVEGFVSPEELLERLTHLRDS